MTLYTTPPTAPWPYLIAVAAIIVLAPSLILAVTVWLDRRTR